MFKILGYLRVLIPVSLKQKYEEEIVSKAATSIIDIFPNGPFMMEKLLLCEKNDRNIKKVIFNEIYMPIDMKHDQTKTRCNIYESQISC